MILAHTSDNVNRLTTGREPIKNQIPPPGWDRRLVSNKKSRLMFGGWIEKIEIMMYCRHSKPTLIGSVITWLAQATLDVDPIFAM